MYHTMWVYNLCLLVPIAALQPVNIVPLLLTCLKCVGLALTAQLCWCYDNVSFWPYKLCWLAICCYIEHWVFFVDLWPACFCHALTLPVSIITCTSRYVFLASYFHTHVIHTWYAMRLCSLHKLQTLAALCKPDSGTRAILVCSIPKSYIAWALLY